jgi:hypothetical protein
MHTDQTSFGASSFSQRPQSYGHIPNPPTAHRRVTGIPMPKPPSRAARYPHPPIPRLYMSLRERLVGQRSLIFVGAMLLRLVWFMTQSVRTAQDLRYEAVGGAVMLMAVMVASSDRRLRTLATGSLCALVWSYAVADPSNLGSPDFRHWPVLLVIGAVAASVELVHEAILSRLSLATRFSYGRRTVTLSRCAVALHAISVLLFVAPLTVIGLMIAATHALSSSPPLEIVALVVSLPPLVGVGVYTIFMVRRLRSLPLAPIRA